MQPSKQATCPKCGEQFDLATIAENPEVDPIGMQLEDGADSYHFFYFNHLAPACGTTFVLPAEDFLPYIKEGVPELSLAGSPGCEHHCTLMSDLQVCHQPCRYAAFRRHLIAMRRRHAEITRQLAAR
jgi:hypothetical protein